MNIATGTHILGKLTVKNRTNKRMEPQHFLTGNIWEHTEPEAFESSLPLKIPVNFQATQNAPIVAELVEAPPVSANQPQRFNLKSVRQANVVIDRSTSGPAHRIANALDEISFPQWASSTTEIFVLCEGSQLLGPLQVAKRKLCARSMAKLEVRRSNDLVMTYFDGYLVADRIDNLPVIDYVDCRPVEEVLNDVATLAVSTLASLDSDMSDLQIARRTLTNLRDWIGGRPDTDGGSLDTQRLERALQACDDADTQVRLASQIATTLTGLPDVAARMDRAIAEARASAERAELDEIEIRVAREADVLARLRKDVHAAQSELHQLNARIAGAQHQLVTAQEAVNARNEELRGDVAIAVEELVSGTRERLASSIIAQALTMERTPGQSRRSPAPTSVDLRPAAESHPAEERVIKKHLITAVKSSGMPARAAERLFAALSTQLLPITLGNGGPAALSAIATLMFSGRIVRIPVAHDFLHPVDLLGLHSAKPETFRHHHGILEAANTEAAAGDVMVLLEGMNQAPTESYLVPWLQNRWDDTEFAALQPHSNLRLAGTIATGITSARISPDLWGYAIAVDVPRVLTWPVGQEFSSVRFVKPTGLADLEIVDHLLDNIGQTWPFSHDIETVARRFAGALRPLQDEEQIHRSLAECILLPVGATSLDDAEYEIFVASMAKNMSLTEEEAVAFHHLAKRFRMRLA
ncbi:hypothetical protein [Nocardia aurea]|uniref:hypothetical protein n=1 Tax=Nocardia aurea TaxID=2144174 RepID=UPI0013003B40|nr:hypothetical protein [Nocardia aurea]